jgi:NAD(P)-dependent dehydrogenase (short-subunit alcohol dehydrogenase family)
MSAQRSGRLAGKVALVAESSEGIGRATALRFAAEGALVVCVDEDPEAARTTAHLAAGGALAMAADVTRQHDCDRVAEAVRERAGRLDILYNNHSTLAAGTLEETTEATWDRVFAVNVKAIYLLSRACLPMLRTNGGSIVNLASSLAFIGYPRLAAYTASKGAVRILTKTMALDLAIDRIRVNCICHGGIDDPILHSLFDLSGDHDRALASFLESIPLGRLASLDDMASAAAFLASEDSASTTGSEVLVDGGQTAH